MGSEPASAPQLSLTQRKRIAAQILLFDGIAELGLESAHATGFDEVAERIRRLAAEDNSAEDDTTTLQAYLETFAERVRAIIENEWPGLADDVWSWLERLFERLSSVPCCAGKDITCRGHLMGDAQAVLMYGYGAKGCIAALREMFDEMTDLARETYGRIGSGVTRDFRLGTRLGPREVGLSAVTILEGNDTTRRSTVILEVQCREWSAEDYFAIPYILAHECLVHGYQAWDGSSDNVRERDPFAEGWIDSLAFKAFEACLTRAKSPSRRTMRIIRAGRARHDRRYGLEQIGRIRSLGFLAAQYFRNLCEALFGGEGAQLADEFALQLNASLADLETRSAFVNILVDMSDERGPTPSPRKSFLERLLREFKDRSTEPSEVARRLRRMSLDK